MPLNDYCRQLLARSYGCLDEKKLGQLDLLYDRVLEVNRVMNITALTDMCDITLKHFADSLSLLKMKELSKGNGRLIDVGCGGGFPGLPLKIALPELEITMLDSTAKKVRSVEETAQKLGLEKMRFVAARAEECCKAGASMRQSYDFAVSRAVAAMPVLCELCLPFLKKDGYFFALKGATAEEELAAARRAIGTLGGKVEEMREIGFDTDLSGLLPTADEKARTEEFFSAKRYIIAVRKVSDTPASFPRPFAKITKKPI